MIELPNSIPAPKPIEGKQAAPSTSPEDVAQSMTQLSMKDGHAAPTQVGHRNSVSSRESSNTNLAQKNKEKSIQRGISAPSGGFGSKKNVAAMGTSDPTHKLHAPIAQIVSESIDELKEELSGTGLEAVKAATALSKSSSKDSSAEPSVNPIKARFLSFSKRLKGTMSGSSTMDLPSVKKNFTVDLKNKNNSSAKLPTFNKQANVPSASAYDITQPGALQQLPKGLDEYYVIRRVGKGGFATVFLIRLKASTGRYFALKVIKKSEVVRLKQEKQIMNEKNILYELKHPLLVDLYSTFQSPSNLFMVLEFVAGGDLFTQLRKAKMFIEPQAKFYVCEVLTVLEYLHSQKVVYRDLKPENILLDSTGHIKLADFGFAKRLTTTTASFCGTPDYIAAEIVASRPYTFTVDWWSLGVLIFELTSGKTPFRADDSEGIYNNIQMGKIQWVPEVSGAIREVVSGLLESDPRKRLGARGADEIKKAAWFAGIQWEKIGHRGINPPVIPNYASPEALEMEKLTKGIQSDYKDILGDTLPNGKFTDPFDGVFKGF
ncbi:camp-dependent protein kinase catalytic subunit [Kappamyces sp. JEL0829]|nr:camp-dependent protein kinase catalytic subunit [Kappamyces sp. JEL0829]